MGPAPSGSLQLLGTFVHANKSNEDNLLNKITCSDILSLQICKIANTGYSPVVEQLQVLAFKVTAGI